MTFHLVEEELPLLTDVIVGTEHLPVLTEVVGEDRHETPITPTATAVELGTPPEPPPALSADEMVRLLQQLETHLETVFATKLNEQLNHLQRLAVDLAVSEFKAELPQLLHEALIQLKHR